MSTDESGDREPGGSLALLWGVREHPRRGPQASLTLERIVEAAVEIADADGLDALSMRRVAESLGFTTMSLYRHVPGKAELLDVMVDSVNRESAIVDDLPGDWRDKLTAVARGEWDLYHRHPWVLQISWSRQALGLGPHGMAAYESALGVVADLGLNGREQLAVLQLVLDYVRGAARTSLDTGTRPGGAGQVHAHQWAEWTQRLARYVDLADYPHIATAWQEMARERTPMAGHDLDFGLQRLLDGLEPLIRPRRG